MPSTTQLQKFLKVDSCKSGDIVNFTDPGQILEKEFVQKDGSKKRSTILEIGVVVNGEKKIYSPNNTTIKILNEAWGTETEAWVGKQGRVKLIEQLSFGKLNKILIVVPKDAPIEDPSDIEV